MMSECPCFNCVVARGNKINGWPETATRMILCPTCGNKRCPHATDHKFSCTGSNDPGQPGSWHSLSTPSTSGEGKRG